MLDLMLAQILEMVIQSVANLFKDTPGDTYAAWVGERFDAGGDVYPLAVDVLAVVDDIAKIDPHAEIEWACRHTVLHGDGAPDGILDGRKLGQETIACMLHDASGMFRDRRVDNVGTGSLPSGDSAVCVLFREPGVAHDIGGKESQIAVFVGPLHPSDTLPPQPFPAYITGFVEPTRIHKTMPPSRLLADIGPLDIHKHVFYICSLPSGAAGDRSLTS